MNIESFPFFRSYLETIDSIEDEKVQLELYRLITHYGLNGKEVKVTSKIAKAIFIAFKVNIENSRKRIIAGSAGGKAKAKQTASKRLANECDSSANKNKNKNENKNISYDASLNPEFDADRFDELMERRTS